MRGDLCRASLGWAGEGTCPYVVRGAICFPLPRQLLRYSLEEREKCDNRNGGSQAQSGPRLAPKERARTLREAQGRLWGTSKVVRHKLLTQPWTLPVVLKL